MGKQNWQYDTKITKDHCSGVHKPKDDPCLDGCLKCNDYNTPHIPNGKWDCKKKHCDLVCNKGYKTKNGKCSLKCENHKWKTIGDPHCVPILPGPTKKPNPTKNPTKPTKKPTKPPKPTTTQKPTTKAPKKCPKFVPVKDGWNVSPRNKESHSVCLCVTEDTIQNIVTVIRMHLLITIVKQVTSIQVDQKVKNQVGDVSRVHVTMNNLDRFAMTTNSMLDKRNLALVKTFINTLSCLALNTPFVIQSRSK